MRHKADSILGGELSSSFIFYGDLTKKGTLLLALEPGYETAEGDKIGSNLKGNSPLP